MWSKLPTFKNVQGSEPNRSQPWTCDNYYALCLTVHVRDCHVSNDWWFSPLPLLILWIVNLTNISCTMLEYLAMADFFGMQYFVKYLWFLLWKYCIVLFNQRQYGFMRRYITTIVSFYCSFHINFKLMFTWCAIKLSTGWSLRILWSNCVLIAVQYYTLFTVNFQACNLRLVHVNHFFMHLNSIKIVVLLAAE